MRKAVAGLKPGQIHGPVQTGSEFVILRWADYRAARMRSLPKAQPEIERRLLRAKQGEIIMAWLTEQEKNSKIEILRQAVRPNLQL